jgi:hypothetical protein
MGKEKKKGWFKKFLLTLVCVLAGIFLVWTALALAGRISPVSVIPAANIVRISVPNPLRLVEGIIEHESLPEIAGNSALASALPLVNALRENAALQNPLLRFVLRGNLEGALLPGAAGPPSFVAAWDAGFLSPLLRSFPLLSGLVNVPHLYYVQAGKYSRFEYRMEDGAVLYAGRRRNLLLVCNDSRFFEAVISGEEPRAGAAASPGPSPAEAYDAVLLFEPRYLNSLFAEQDPAIAAVMRNLEFPEPVEAGISIAAQKLELRLRTRTASASPALNRFLNQRSRAPGLAERLPAGTQYSTILSAGKLEELYEAAAVFSGPDLGDLIRQADSSSRLVLGLSLDELLFSWSGAEFAVFGMEGRPNPVYAVQVLDERKRQEVFDRAFKTIVLNENLQLNLDGVRIPRVEVPGFLQTLLRRWDFRVPSPYYTVHEGYLFICESAETLLVAVRAIQKNDVLPKTAAWRNIAGARADTGAFSLYYSLDRSLPFFLRKNTVLSAVLGVYRQGLLRLGFDQGEVRLSLSVVPGSGHGITLFPGYPLGVGGNPLNRVQGIITGKAGENRLLLSRDNAAIAVNGADNRVYELESAGQGQLWVISAGGLPVKSAADPAAWVVSAQGRVTLVNGNMEPAPGFPQLTGVRLSAPPSAYGGKVFICGEDGKVRAVDADGIVVLWETVFPAALRSPPSFLRITKSGADYAAVYPKSFFSEIWLLDAEGRTLPGWPAAVSGIAFGSPLLFSHNNQLRAAFVTQGGELSVFDETALSLPPFPLSIDGVFYHQPVFDGEYLWLISENGTLFQVSLGGEVLYQQIPHFSVKEEGFITAFDSSGDAVPEIFITGAGNALHGYSRGFRSLEGFPLPVWGQPLFADLNGDGKPECVGVGMDRRLYRWQFK